ncbi:MAG: hypothetical protein EBR23_13925, partial [Planctomycetia bacterium]|nr:hypothetical protein [Planctomycetia bacterium]
MAGLLVCDGGRSHAWSLPIYTPRDWPRTAANASALAGGPPCVNNTCMRLGVLGSDAGIDQVVAAARARGDSILVVPD